MIVNCMSDENDLKRRPVDVVEPKDYGHGFQLKQAASQSVDSSLKMLSSAVQALSTGYAEYSSLLQRGILLLGVAADIESARLGGVGSGFEDEMVACRCEVASLRSRIGDMVFLYEEVKKLAESAAGVAFLTGNELASSLASSHLYHVHIEVIVIAGDALVCGSTYILCAGPADEECCGKIGARIR